MQRRHPGPFYLCTSTDFSTHLLKNAIFCLCCLLSAFTGPCAIKINVYFQAVWFYKDAHNGCDTCSVSARGSYHAPAYFSFSSSDVLSSTPLFLSFLLLFFTSAFLNHMSPSAYFLFPIVIFHLSLPLPGPLAQVEALKEENDSLRCQLDAYRNEVELLKQEQGKAQPHHSEEDTTRQQQLSFLQQALQGMQKVRTHTPNKTERTGTHLWAVLCNGSQRSWSVTEGLLVYDQRGAICKHSLILQSRAPAVSRLGECGVVLRESFV